MSELKPCPWCGTNPEGIPSVSGVMYWQCSNSMCIMQSANLRLTENTWNNSYAEQENAALRARAVLAEALLEAEKCGATLLFDEKEKLRERIAKLEKVWILATAFAQEHLDEFGYGTVSNFDRREHGWGPCAVVQLIDALKESEVAGE